MDFNKAMELIELHEGRRKLPYKDTEGILTIGVGINLEEGLHDNEIDFLFENRLRLAYDEAKRAFPDFEFLSAIRKIVIVDMLFNLGLPRLRGFRKMWAAIAQKDYTLASTEMLDSKWATQVGNRATRLAWMMKEDAWPQLP